MIVLFNVFLALLALLLPAQAIFVGVPVQSSNEYPYMVSIRTAQGHLCGGVLASPNRVITVVASCMSGQRAEDLVIRGGAPTSTSYSQTPDVQVQSIYVHPEFAADENGIYNNIAILYLSSNLYLPHAQLALKGNVPRDGTSVMLVGYGQSYYGEQPGGPQHLMKVFEPVKPISRCQQSWGAMFDISESQNFCSGRAGTGACMGDQGGPVINQHNVVVGLISHMPCGNPDFLDVNVKLAVYAPWIQSHGVPGYTFASY